MEWNAICYFASIQDIGLWVKSYWVGKRYRAGSWHFQGHETIQ